MKHVDVAIFGGGPAGALTAALLCRQNPGIRVAVLEKEQFPRHHVGEVTLPGWAAILARAGAREARDQRCTHLLLLFPAPAMLLPSFRGLIILAPGRKAHLAIWADDR